MKLFPRLFFGHVLVISIVLLVLFIVVELIAPSFYRHHVEQMVALLGPAGHVLRTDLEAGMRSTLTSALLASLPLVIPSAAITAFLTSQRIVRPVQILNEGSQALASGKYARRLPEAGRDELTELARNFNVMASHLERVERDRIALIGNVGHELRTPLAALRGYAEALADGVMAVEHVSPAIVREARAIERLALDLSLVSKVEAGQVELRPVRFHPQTLVQAAADRFEGAYAERGIRLNFDLAAELAMINADLERSLQVVSNLLSNALRYTPKGGQVTVRAQPSSKTVIFSVHNTGSTIAPEHLERIFDRFYRIDPARTRGEGSGVGLTIARGLVEQMGGSIQVKSGLDGTTFTFTLPTE